jgi:hypothetical protein
VHWSLSIVVQQLLMIDNWIIFPGSNFETACVFEFRDQLIFE